jgi:hypothetical protein
MWRARASGAPLSKLNSQVPSPQDVGSNPVKDREDPSVHGVNSTFPYKVYSQEESPEEWAARRPMPKCYAHYLPELQRYVGVDGAIHLPFNGLIYLPIIPRAFDGTWGQWHIPWYLHKKWVIRELVLRFENNGSPAETGTITTWTVGVNDELVPEEDPRNSNDCVEFSAALPYQWSIPLTYFGPTEKWVVAPPEKRTRTGEVDGPVVCLQVQSLEAGVKPSRLLGTITMKLVVKLIEPVPRKLYTQTQAIEEFGSSGGEGIQSSDQVSSRAINFNEKIPDRELMSIYTKKKGHHMSHHCKCAFPLAVNYHVSSDMRLLGLGVINEGLYETGVRIVAMVDKLPLSMGLYGETYNELLCKCWGSVDTVNGFKSILPRTSNENSLGHENRLNKFGAYPITHHVAQWDVIQRNGRAKTVESQTGNWTFHDGPREVVIAKGGLYAVANRLDLHNHRSTPEDAVPYFTGDDFGPYANIYNYTAGGECTYGTGMLGVDFPVEFAFGECFMGQIPIFTGSNTNDTTGPLCVGFDPKSGSQVGVELTRHEKKGGRGMNLNRTCITKALPNPAVDRKPAPLVDPSKKRSKRLSFDEFEQQDDSTVSIDWGSLGQTLLSVAKKAASFVISALPEARYINYHGREDEDSTATPLFTAMRYYLPQGYTGPYTTVGEINPLIVNLGKVHLAYAVSNDPNQQQPYQLSFARLVDNEISGNDKRVSSARVIQLSISGDIEIQKFVGVPRGRVNNLVRVEQQRPGLYKGFQPGLPNPYSSTSDQVTQIIENYGAVLGSIEDHRGGYMYNDGHNHGPPHIPDQLGPAPATPEIPVAYDDLKEKDVLRSRSAVVDNDGQYDLQRGQSINIFTNQTKCTIITTPVVVTCGNPFHPTTNPMEFGTPLVQLSQHRTYKTILLDPYYIDERSHGQIRTVFEQPDDGREDRAQPEQIEFGIIALIQATTTLNIQVAVPVPKSFYDRQGVERFYGTPDYPNVYYGLLTNVELIMSYNAGTFQVTDTYNGAAPGVQPNIGGLSPVGFMMTSHIDPRLILLDNNPDVEKVILAFPCAKYGPGPASGLRVAHINQEMKYIRELGIVGSGDDNRWQENSQFAGTAFGIVQLSCGVAMMSGEDSAQPANLDDD